MTRLVFYTIERTFAVPAARVFRALVDPEDLVVWAWGPGARDTRAEVDARVGGGFHVSTDGAPFGKPGGRAGMLGTYVVLDPPRRLVQTLRWDAPVGYNAPGMDPLDEAVIVELEPQSGGTRLRWTHVGVPDGVAVREHERGVGACLDLLAAHLTGEVAKTR